MAKSKQAMAKRSLQFARLFPGLGVAQGLPVHRRHLAARGRHASADVLLGLLLRLMARMFPTVE